MIPLFQQLNQQPKMNNSMLDILKHANNPQAMLMTMAQNNPQVRQIISEVQNNGGDAKSLFYKKANEMGVNPKDILSKLK